MLVWVLTQQKTFHTMLIVPVVRQQGQDFKVCVFPGQANIWVKPLCCQLSQMPSLPWSMVLRAKQVTGSAGVRIQLQGAAAMCRTALVMVQGRVVCRRVLGLLWSWFLSIASFCTARLRQPLWSLTKTKQWTDARKPCLNLCTPSVFW